MKPEWGWMFDRAWDLMKYYDDMAEKPKTAAQELFERELFMRYGTQVSYQVFHEYDMDVDGLIELALYYAYGDQHIGTFNKHTDKGHHFSDEEIARRGPQD